MKKGLITAALIALLFKQPDDFTSVIAVEMGFAALTTAAQVKEQAKAECCKDCKGKGYVTHGDGHNTVCICPDTCACKKGFQK